MALQTLKFFLASDTQHATLVTSAAQGNSSHPRSSNYDLEPSRDPGSDTSPEELALIRAGARKVLNSFQSTLSEQL